MDNREITVVERQFNDIQSLVNDVDGQIQDQATYETVLMIIERSKDISRKWCGLFEDIRKAQKEALDVTYATINKIKNPCAEWVKILTPKAWQWEQKQREQARLLEIKLNEEAKKQADDARLREAEALAQTGQLREADAVLVDVPPPAPVVVTVMPAPSAANLSRRTTWKARVVDLPALIAAVYNKQPGVPSNAVIANQAVLDGLAKAMQGELKLPGVEVYEDAVYARSSR